MHADAAGRTAPVGLIARSTLVSVFAKSVRDRWRGMVIGVVVVGLLLGFGMSAYGEIDLSVYTELPEVFRSLINIPPDADVASLAYGAIYGSYGALTLAALALAIGAAAIAGEERDATLGLLLGNPKSRTQVLAGKAGALVLLTALGALGLWAAARVAPVVLDVDVSGMHVEALVVHLFANSVFYGFLALAIGAWTGRRALAAGVTTAVMVVGLFAAGLFPLVSGWEDLARAVPWHYFNSSQPVLNGVDVAHLAVLLGGSAVFGAAAVVGVRRRDLRGAEMGVTVLDRLRSHPLTSGLADRLAGAARVSRIWVKTASDHQAMLFVTAMVMALMCVMIGPMYTLIDEPLAGFADDFPETMLALFGGGDLSTPEGFYQIEIFGLMAPIAVMVVTVAIAARALAGEEERRTMGLLLANPLPRSRVVIEKSVAMAVHAAVVGLAIFGSVALGSALGGLGMRLDGIAAAALLVTLLGLLFGALALALGAATGRSRVAVFGAIGAALAFHVANAVLPLAESLAGWARLTPFHYYLSSDPLANGLAWSHAALLAGLTVALVAVAATLFERRDLRQPG